MFLCCDSILMSIIHVHDRTELSAAARGNFKARHSEIALHPSRITRHSQNNAWPGLH